MPIKAMCPECEAQYHAPDSAAGRKIKCRACEFVFSVPGETPRPAPKKPSVPKDPWETDDFGDEDDVPLLKPVKKKKSGDGLPPKIGKAKKKSTYLTDDDGEDEPRPKKKRKKQAEEHDPRLVFLAIALGVVVLAGLAGLFEPKVTLWVGILAIAGGGLWQLTMAFEEDDMTGWLHMRLPGYSLYFAITRIGQTWPAIVVQALGLVLCVSYVALEHRREIGGIARALAAPQGAGEEVAEDAEDIPLLKAARPFASALAARNYDAAFATLSPLAQANAFRDQFVPSRDDEKQRVSVAPLTIESFKELMAESEKVLGAPKNVEDLYVESRDPDILAGRGDAIERMFVLGGTPESIPAGIRRASLRATVLVKHPEAEEDDEPYLNLRIILIEEQGQLQVGYFELSPPSILD